VPVAVFPAKPCWESHFNEARVTQIKNAAILGVSGYTGAEAVRLLLSHPQIKIKALTAQRRAGRALPDLYPQFSGFDLPDVTTWQDVDWDEINVVFVALPHGASQDIVGQVAGEVETVIDLSADFRLRDPDLYMRTYGRPHTQQDLLSKAVYGLTEYARDDLRDARIVACPGCYPTCSLLSLLPAVKADMLELDSLIIDAKSGATGAGRKASDGLIYSQLTDGAHAYDIGHHRHGPEIDQMLTSVSGQDVTVSFTPHLLPMSRGMITTTYANLKKGLDFQDLRAVYEPRYCHEPFIYLESPGVVPQTRHIRGTNQFRLGLFEDRVPGSVIITGVLDNLVKGSSGQAIQNYNLTQGWNETLGLAAVALFP